MKKDIEICRELISSNVELNDCRVNGMFSDDNNLWVVIPSKGYELKLQILKKMFADKYNAIDFAMVNGYECEVRFINRKAVSI